MIFRALLAIACLVTAAGPVFAHGSVTPDADLCIIKIGYLKAHFKLYQPNSRGQQDYCEDLPDTGETFFIMEYEHAGLGELPIDFRVIENVTGKGRFANLDDIRQITDLDDVTVLHHESAVQPDVFMLRHDFTDSGSFIGVVTVQQPETGKTYVAVFPFEVDYVGLGFWPWVALIVIMLQLNYLWLSGWFERRRLKPAPAAIMLLVLAATTSADEQVYASRSGQFEVRFESELEPLTINKMHSWVLYITDESGTPVVDAEVAIDGGMPEHNHGLPTEPQMSDELGGGAYRFDGMRFHMRGAWEIVIRIQHADRQDVVTIPLEL